MDKLAIIGQYLDAYIAADPQRHINADNILVWLASGQPAERAAWWSRRGYPATEALELIAAGEKPWTVPVRDNGTEDAAALAAIREEFGDDVADRVIQARRDRGITDAIASEEADMEMQTEFDEDEAEYRRH